MARRGGSKRGPSSRKGQRKWISKAIKRPGAFRKYCKRKGYKGVTDQCIKEALRSKNPRLRKQAVLARTLRRMHHRRRARKKTGKRR